MSCGKGEIQIQYRTTRAWRKAHSPSIFKQASTSRRQWRGSRTVMTREDDVSCGSAQPDAAQLR